MDGEHQLYGLWTDEFKSFSSELCEILRKEKKIPKFIWSPVVLL